MEEGVYRSRLVGPSVNLDNSLMDYNIYSKDKETLGGNQSIIYKVDE